MKYYVIVEIMDITLLTGRALHPQEKRGPFEVYNNFNIPDI